MITTRLIGITDEVLQCDLCGQENLKRTVVLDIDGDIVYYGSDCASRHLGGSRAQVESRARNADRITREQALEGRKRLSQLHLPLHEEPTDLEWRAACIRYGRANPSVPASQVLDYVKSLYQRSLEAMARGSRIGC